ncbi:hypothetical protein F53441_7261 [Fusarium austroafricanum]|uniref:Uncharacterized protein n=1 Tax=Fusarium austroafricanum TaxID=2364996 RepID=A0A8H4KDZ9_9HYPO|nr:hypothetical protein F53441_7261 [Fusarium austroafricanum]
MANQKNRQGDASPSTDLPKDLIEYHRLYSKADDIPAVSSFALDPTCYEDNQDRLRDLFRKFDFYPIPGKIVIWMASMRHSRFTDGVESCIKKQLEVLQDTLPGRITSNRDGVVKLKDKSKLNPDAPFQYSGDEGHGKRLSLVIEVANAQSYESLMRKTRHYFAKARGHVKTIVCFDIQYDNKPSQASTVMEPTAFQSKNGQPVNMEKTLRLPLRDMAPKNMDTSSWPDSSISAPLYQLSEILADAIKSEREQNEPLSSDSEDDEENSGGDEDGESSEEDDSNGDDEYEDE